METHEAITAKTDELNVGQYLEAMQTIVLHAVWAADIEKHFTSSPANVIVGKNVLDRGIIRFCQQAFLLWFAKLFDNNKQAASLRAFLEYAGAHTEEFDQSSEVEVTLSVAKHLEWMNSDDTKKLIKKLRKLRDKELAHLDLSVVTGSSDENMAASENFVLEGLSLTLVERVTQMLDEVIGIIKIYSEYYDGRTFNIDNVRNPIKKECERYIEFCHERDKVRD